MSMHESNVFVWLAERLGFGEHVDGWWISVAGSLMVFLVILVLSLLVWWRMKKIEGSVIPSEKVSLENVAEIMVEWLLKILGGILGDRAERFLPIIGTLFIYIFLCNLMGFIPGFISPTAVITTNFACAIVVFIYYNYVGIKEKGLVRYLKGFMGPVVWLAPLFICIELVSHLVRPISLSIRLYGNMVGDHLVLGVFSDLVPVIVPVFFVALGLFIAFVQAFVFAILSAVYIALAIEH